MTLCNLNIEMGGRSGLRRAGRGDVPVDRRPALCAAGRDVGSRARALAHACEATRAPSSTASHARLRRRSSRRSPGAPTRARCSAFPTACPIPSADRRSGPARRDRKRARLYGAYARHGARRPAGQSRVHRLLHQRAAAGPAGRRRRRARPARRRRRGRHGGAGLVDREARGGGRGPRPGVPRRRLLLGRVRLLDVRRRQRRPRRAGRAHASPPPTAISSTARARRVRTHLVSPATAAATAIAGRIADVRQIAGRA